MKLTARDIGVFLKQPDKQSRGVLLYGPDSGLVHERSKLLATAILGPKSDPLNRVDITTEQIKADPVVLRDELCAMSLMGGRRLVVVQATGEKVGPLIAAALEGLETSTYLIVEAEELSPSAGLRYLFEKDPMLAALPCYRDEGRGLEETIRSAFTQHGLRAGPDAMHYLADSLGNDRGVTASELEKIALYMGQEKEVTLTIAMELTGQNANQTIDDVCHAVASGKQDHAHALLVQLMHEGTQPVSIVRSLIKHFQRLDLVQAHMAGGQSVEQAIAGLRPAVFFKYVPVMKREVLQLGGVTITHILNFLLRAEKELKSSTLAPTLLASQTVLQASRMAA